MECVALVDGGWLFDKLPSVEFNEYISIRDSIFVIIVLMFNMIFSTGCSLRIAARRGSFGQRGMGE